MFDDLPPIHDEKAVISILAIAIANILQIVAAASAEDAIRLMTDTRRVLAPVLTSPNLQAGDKLIVDRVLAIADQAIENTRHQIN